MADLDAREAYAFDVNGDRHLISGVDVDGYDAVIVVHPAEPKFPAASVTTGATIEVESSTSAVGGVTMNAECNPEVSDCSNQPPDPPGGGGGSPPEPSTRVTGVFPDFDDGVFGGNVELYWKTASTTNPGVTFQSAKVSVEPYEYTGWLNVKIFNAAASQSLPLRAELWESDGFLNGDDYKGEPWPTNITGAGDVASFDPFVQIFWAEYDVAVTQ